MSFTRSIRLSALTLLLATTIAVAEETELRIATQVSGTVNWELTTIAQNGLDKANGFTMTIQDVAAGPAAQLAFQAGEADVIVSDWLWVARERAEGQDYVFIPYSRAVGALHVPKDSPINDLAELKGAKIGIAGGPIDKSWLILRAYAQQEKGFDLAAETEQVFGAPPLIFETAIAGDLDGAVNFWHFGAKMEAAGMRPLITVAEAAEALGLDPGTPLLGYVVRGEMLREQPELVAGLAAASRGAKAILATDDAAWQALRPIMNAKTDAQFEALVAGFRAGIPAPGPVDEDAAQRMLRLMADLGGEELLGKVTDLPSGVFLQPES
ncbi:ABC transporter substrate-binding protein [Pseudotabrizicola algicola]|uniref:ABC transporter substrate-binding protein n=1 Tax=Pseudotabrizicola algicola TaxID=2709381 RepID=A0A6B3RXT8_9RHOB|nr:ABC transporter substrate-binding protein [Pseudotabrizicola algicola]NEX47942.1 ABC transporter substrate-binding protein [Pseudotabrizicola algicola]